MEESATPSTHPPPRPMAIDSADHDFSLSKSGFLTREELLRRRLRRSRQLARCYRAHYWALMEDLRSRYRHYCWTYGKSGFKDRSTTNNNHNNAKDSTAENENGVVDDDGGDDIVRCRFGGCKSKAMALTRFCHAHILSDPKQKLYRGCRTVAKTLPTGPSFCNKPVLRTVVPPKCPIHYQLAERCLIRAMRKAGPGSTIPTNRKPNVNLHVVAPEFIHYVQNNRKLAFKDIVPKAETG